MSGLAGFVLARLAEVEARVRNFEHRGALALNGDFGSIADEILTPMVDAMGRFLSWITRRLTSA